MAVFVTGGAGYIGSHTCVELLNSGYEVIIADNFYNSKPCSLKAVGEITGKEIAFPPLEGGVKPFSGSPNRFYEVDICDGEGLDKIFADNDITEVIHFAGYKAVSESVVKPIDYYRNNVGGAITLLEVMKNRGVKKFVFSSTATVYGEPKKVPVDENSPLAPVSPYACTKLAVENICRDICTSDGEWEISLLRYFNPVGAHQSGLLGEDPNGIPNNLMPVITRVAGGVEPVLNVYGNDYPTADGTCVRDYIHVADLAKGHIAALKNLKPGAEVFNFGTGRGNSVLEVIEAFERANNVKVPWEFAPRRPGDTAEYYTKTDKAERELNWKAELDLQRMCGDSWNYYIVNC